MYPSICLSHFVCVSAVTEVANNRLLLLLILLALVCPVYDGWHEAAAESIPRPLARAVLPPPRVAPVTLLVTNKITRVAHIESIYQRAVCL